MTKKGIGPLLTLKSLADTKKEKKGKEKGKQKPGKKANTKK